LRTFGTAEEAVDAVLNTVMAWDPANRLPLSGLQLVIGFENEQPQTVIENF